MIGEEVSTAGLSALFVAAAELIEDHHDELVSVLPQSAAERKMRVERLRQLGSNLQALADAGSVLISSAPESSEDLRSA